MYEKLKNKNIVLGANTIIALTLLRLSYWFSLRVPTTDKMAEPNTVVKCSTIASSKDHLNSALRWVQPIWCQTSAIECLTPNNENAHHPLRFLLNRYFGAASVSIMTVLPTMPLEWHLFMQACVKWPARIHTTASDSRSLSLSLMPTHKVAVNLFFPHSNTVRLRLRWHSTRMNIFHIQQNRVARYGAVVSNAWLPQQFESQTLRLLQPLSTHFLLWWRALLSSAAPPRLPRHFRWWDRLLIVSLWWWRW